MNVSRAFLSLTWRAHYFGTGDVTIRKTNREKENYENLHKKSPNSSF